ncbi:MAG: alpha/beta hydrolase [bacterium]|nr:alpha/beta hydrolase [bacterium]
MGRRDDLEQGRRRSRWRRWLLATILAGSLAWLACGWLTIAVATAPHPASITARTELDGHLVEAVAATTHDGLEVRAWLVRRSEHRIVILLAGLGGNRTSNLGVAGSYLARGWSVLLPDLRGTGESAGDRIGFGYPERLDLLAWLQLARRRGFQEIGLHGQSLGAATITYAWQQVEGASAIGADIATLRPIDRVASIRCPTLVLAGDQDPYARPDETRALFAACGARRKQLTWIRGGRHENLWTRSPTGYREALDAFLIE